MNYLCDNAASFSFVAPLNDVNQHSTFKVKVKPVNAIKYLLFRYLHILVLYDTSQGRLARCLLFVEMTVSPDGTTS